MILRQSERIVFLGDSITEAHGFSNMAETWLSLRFPKRRLSFFNAGWGGDTAPGALKRLDRDVLRLRPTLVVLCLGMNDGGYGYPRPEIIGNYASHLQAIVRRLKKAKARVVLLTNGFADDSANPEFLKPANYNLGVLPRIVAAAKRVAKAERLPCHDLHSLMNRVDRQGKRASKGFGMAPDGFHPNPAGHLVMAYGALRALGIRSSRSLQRVAARKTSWGYEASFRPSHPPFVVEPAARAVLPYLDFQKRFNDQRVAFSGLKPGRYVLTSGAWRSPAYSAAELAKGVSTAAFYESPFMRKGWDLQVFVNGMRDIYARYWRALGMSGGYGAYREPLHRLGLKAMPELEKAKRTLLLQAPEAVSLRILPASLGRAEPVLNGEFIGPWLFSPAFRGDFKRDWLKGRKMAWKPVRVDTNNPTHCFGNVLGRLRRCVAYAKTSIHSPLEQQATLLFGSGDGYELWLNGELLGSRLDLRRTSFADQERFSVSLRRGKNELLVKVTQQEVQWWGFHARFTGLEQPVLAG